MGFTFLNGEYKIRNIKVRSMQHVEVESFTEHVDEALTRIPGEYGCSKMSPTAQFISWRGPQFFAVNRIPPQSDQPRNDVKSCRIRINIHLLILKSASALLSMHWSLSRVRMAERAP